MLGVVAFKQVFFDRKAVTDAVDRGTLLAFSKFGSFVRRRDKSSLKYREGKSAAGAPPHVHRAGGFTREKKNRKTGADSRQAASPLRELTFFGYSAKSAGGATASAGVGGGAGFGDRSVVIGPAMFRGSAGTGVAPRTIEEGGVGKFRTARGELKRGTYRARPHTGPAFRAELPRAAAMFKDRIH